jgi:biotin synthase
LRRICIQTLKYPGLADDLMELLNDIKKHSQLPISVCVNPLGTQTLQMLRMSGVDRIGIGLDCASERIFNLIKPGFSWKEYTYFIENVVDVFGKATAHLIVGLGETDEEMAAQFQRLLDMNCSIGLFAYTPVRGNQMDIDSPIIGRYRAFQLIRYLFVNKLADFRDVVIKNNRLEAINISSTILRDALWNGEAYQTSGCPGCNRPMYNERPGKTTYNYAEMISREQLHGAVEQLISYLPSVGMLR